MKVKAKIKTTDVIIAWIDIDGEGYFEDIIEVIDYVENVDAEVIELID